MYPLTPGGFAWYNSGCKQPSLYVSIVHFHLFAELWKLFMKKFMKFHEIFKISRFQSPVFENFWKFHENFQWKNRSKFSGTMLSKQPIVWIKNCTSFKKNSPQLKFGLNYNTIFCKWKLHMSSLVFYINYQLRLGGWWILTFRKKDSVRPAFYPFKYIYVVKIRRSFWRFVFNILSWEALKESRLTYLLKERKIIW